MCPYILQGSDRDGAAGEVDARRGDLQELGRAAPGPVQGLADGPVPGGLAPGRGEEGRALLSVQIKPVSGGVMQAHFGHNEQNTRILLNMESRMSPPPYPFGGPGVRMASQMFHTITHSVE